MRGSVELHERLIIFQTGRDSQPRNQDPKILRGYGGFLLLISPLRLRGVPKAG